jgi:diaminopimelate decarboxylase
MSKT